MSKASEVPTRRIVGAVITGGKIYKAGDEEAFAQRMAGRDMSALVARGDITGDWSDVEDATPTAAKNARKTTKKGRARGNAFEVSTPTTGDDTGDDTTTEDDTE